MAHEAFVDIQAGEYARARGILERALRLAPQNPTLWSYLGVADSRLLELDDAIAAFQRVVSLAPHDSHGYFDLGVIYLKKGAVGQALQAYRQGLALEPNNVTANRNYAFLLMKAGKFREAVQPLRKLKRMRSTDLAVRVALIESLLKCGMVVSGQRELSEFLELPSATPPDQVKLANVLAEDHQFPAAREVLEHVVQSSPDLAEAHAQLGTLLLHERKYEDAARQLGRAVQLEPASAQYSLALAEVLLKWQNYQTALAFLKAIKDRFGDLANYQYKMAWAHYGLNQVPEAAGVLERLTQQHPDLDLAHYSLGNCYLALSRLKDAECQYRIAIKLNPKKGSYYAGLGQALRKEGNGKIDEAIADFEEALELDPADTASQLQLALCYEQKTNLSKAQQLLEGVIRERPNLLAAHRVLARIYYRQGKKQQGDRQTAMIAKLDSEQLQQRARLIGSFTPPDF
jgi:tetratricopeptide (TPR) repeat protein